MSVPDNPAAGAARIIVVRVVNQPAQVIPDVLAPDLDLAPVEHRYALSDAHVVDNEDGLAVRAANDEPLVQVPARSVWENALHCRIEGNPYSGLPRGEVVRNLAAPDRRAGESGPGR